MGEKMSDSRAKLAKIIDSTNVRATATKSEIQTLCKEAVQFGIGCVCVNPVYVKFAASLLRGSAAKLSSTVGFPFGVSVPETKALEGAKALEEGANELDMVINLSALKSSDYDFVKHDIAAVVDLKHSLDELIVKVIIEAGLLTRTEKEAACRLAKEAGADFVKTSTGFFGKGATVEDIRLMRQVVGTQMGVKAAGGIRTYADAVAMIEAGANRIGTSSAVAVIKGAPR
jgi:deoxyribose-phosphate aldolase